MITCSGCEYHETFYDEDEFGVLVDGCLCRANPSDPDDAHAKCCDEYEDFDKLQDASRLCSAYVEAA